MHLVADMDIDDDELEDIDDLGDASELQLNDGLADNIGIAANGIQHKHENQHNCFDGPNQNEEQHNHFGGPNQDNKLQDPIINFNNQDDDDDGNNNHVILLDLSSSNSDSHNEFYNTKTGHKIQ